MIAIFKFVKLFKFLYFNLLYVYPSNIFIKPYNFKDFGFIYIRTAPGVALGAGGRGAPRAEGRRGLEEKLFK